MSVLTGLALVTVVACTSAAAADETHGPVLGAAVLTGDAPRVVLPQGAAVRVGEQVMLLFLNLAAPGDLRIGAATVGAALPDSGDLEEGRRAFALSVKPETQAIGFALIGPAPEIAMAGGRLRVDVTGDGQPETLTACLTTEAVQLRATDDAGIDVWSEYLPLGYDVEQTCP